jgi:hypothetical protein
MRRGSTLSRAFALVVVLAAPIRAVAQAESPALAKGIDLFKNLDDEQAASTLRRFLVTAPEPHEAALAHLYLGLIALNAGDQQLAREEFAETVGADPTVDVPPNLSPKAQLLLDSVRRQVLRGERAKQPTPQLQPTPLIARHESSPPPVAEAVSPAPEPEVAKSPSTAPAWITGAIAVAALGTGIAFGLLQQSANSQAVQAPDASQATSLANQGATDGVVADIAYGASGVAAIACIVLIITEASGHRSEPPKMNLSLTAGPGGAGIVGRF